MSKELVDKIADSILVDFYSDAHNVKSRKRERVMAFGGLHIGSRFHQSVPHKGHDAPVLIKVTPAYARRDEGRGDWVPMLTGENVLMAD